MQWADTIPGVVEQQLKNDSNLGSAIEKLKSHVGDDSLVQEVLKRLRDRDPDCGFSEGIKEKMVGLEALMDIWSVLPAESSRAISEKFSSLSLDEQRSLVYLHAAIWGTVTQYVADPKLIPPHTTGGALDCTLLDVNTGQEANMGTPINEGEPAEIYTFCKTIPDEAKELRRLLYSSMYKAGLSNYAAEWWHYSSGDQIDAIVRGKTCAKYGSVSLAQVKASISAE